VFRFGLVPDDGPRRAIDALVVAPHKDLEQRGIPAAHTSNDLRVAEARDQRLRRHGYPLECSATAEVATRPRDGRWREQPDLSERRLQHAYVFTVGDPALQPDVQSLP